MPMVMKIKDDFLIICCMFSFLDLIQITHFDFVQTKDSSKRLLKNSNINENVE